LKRSDEHHPSLLHSLEIDPRASVDAGTVVDAVARSGGVANTAAGEGTCANRKIAQSFSGGAVTLGVAVSATDVRVGAERAE